MNGNGVPVVTASDAGRCEGARWQWHHGAMIGAVWCVVVLVAWWGAMLEPWAFMWVLAWAIYFGCKLTTWLRGWWREGFGTAGRAVGYLLAWPGMDPQPFAAMSREPLAVAKGRWLRAWAMVGAGVLCMAAAMRVNDAYVAGWLGMVGTVLMLHFGVFALMAYGWRRVGVAVEPIMDQPVLARSPGEFWGRRWNRGFVALVRAGVFGRLRQRLPASAALMVVFLVSGLVHDVVISLPAGGGYGWPTIYFLVQGVGVLAARSRVGRVIGWRKGGVMARLLTAALVLGPIGWLFHEPFVLKVMSPFVAALRDAIPWPSEWTRGDLVRLGGVLHLGILIGSACVPGTLAWRTELARVSPMTRQLVWTHGAFIVLVIIGMGVVSLTHAEILANGDPLARSIAAFISCFWGARLMLQFIAFDARPYLTNVWLRMGYHGLTVVFSMLVVIYGYVAW